MCSNYDFLLDTDLCGCYKGEAGYILKWGRKEEGPCFPGFS